MQKVKGVTKRIFCIFLVVVMSLYIVIGFIQDIKASADSNDRISCFIHLASGKNVTTEDLENLSEEELRFLGVFLSNFYVPFGTSVGYDNDKDEDLDKKVKKQMVDSLKSQMNFDEKVATVLVDKVYQNIRGSCTELKVYLGTGDKSDHCTTDPKKYYDITEVVPANYYNFYRCMIGRADDVFKGYMHSEDNIVQVKDSEENPTDDWLTLDANGGNFASRFKNYFEGNQDKSKAAKYLYFGYTDKDDKVHVVADCILNAEDVKNNGCKNSPYTTEYTASQIAFLRCLDLVDINKGYGYSFSDLTIDDVGGTDKLYDWFKNHFMRDGKDGTSEKIEEMYKYSIYNQNMAVDCFGDILRLGGVHQTIVVPGCMNPYTWKGVTADGKTNNPGRFYPLMNLRDISRIGEKKDDYGSLEDKKTLVSFKPKFDNLNSHIEEIYNGSSSKRWDDLTETFSLEDFVTVDDSIIANSKAGLIALYGSAAMRYTEGSSDKENYTSYTSDKGGQVGIHAFILGSIACANGYKGRIWKDMDEIQKEDNSSEKIANFGEDRFADRIGGAKGRHTTNGLGFPFVSKEFCEKFAKGTGDWAYEKYPTVSQMGNETDEIYVVLPRSQKKHSIPIRDDTYTSYVGAGQGDGACRAFSNLVLIDNLGLFEGKEFSAFNSSSLIDGDASNIDVKKSDTNFQSALKEMKKGSLQAVDGVSKQALCSLYVSYAYAAFGDEELLKDLGYKLNTEGLPSMKEDPIELDQSIIDEMVKDQQEESIKNWIYYILHPTDGFNYMRTLITNKLNHLLLGWHSDIVGTNGTGSSVGTTRYKSNMGYVTMPDLSEIQWTDSLINLYNSCIPYLIILLIIIMLFAFITGALSLQHALLGTVIFAVFTMIPVNLINGVVEKSNLLSQNVYGDKFVYWALVQHQSYLSEINKAVNQSSNKEQGYNNYLRQLYGANEAVYDNQGNDSIQVKWQAPKKLASLVVDSESGKSVNTNEKLKKILSNSLQNTYSGESFLDDEDAVYLYRNYIDLSNFSLYIYSSKGLTRGDEEGINKAYKRGKLNEITTKYWSEFNGGTKKSLSQATLNKMYKDYSTYIKSGYINGPISDTGEESSDFGDQKHITAPLTSEYINVNALSTSIKDLKKIKNLADMKKSGIKINQDIFNFGLAQFNAKDWKNGTNRWDTLNFAATGGFSDSDRVNALDTYKNTQIDSNKYYGADSSKPGSGVDSDTYNLAGLAAYALYSENPYYYFSWCLYDQGLSCDSKDKEGYKDLILGKGKNGYFNNAKGNGELKDFMDMRGLFTYIIPYMKQLNNIVREWDEKYGIFIYDGVPTEEGQWDKVKNDPELLSKYWHNLNVARLYDIYCPWVDVMYDCSYAKPEKISYLGKSFIVQDPIDPSSYPSDRPMIFSKSEMVDYGLSEGDLTKVERLILKTNEGMRDRMYELLNYYNFNDSVVNSAAAIECAFEFNSNFSESGIFTDNHNIYPQSFDLSNFSYDAFLRFILSNATGESMLTQEDNSDSSIVKSTGKDSGDFYERLVNRSSTLTVVLMLILDIISVYIIPGMRVVFLIAIFLVSFMIILTSAMRVEENMKFVRKAISQFVLPLLKFFAVTVAFSLVVSVFMGTGSNSVTQTSSFSISFGDPALTMILMIALDIVVIILYFKILSKVIKDVIHSAKLVGNFTAGVVGGVAVGALGAVGTAGSAIKSSSKAVVGTGKSAGKEGSFAEDKVVGNDRATSRGQGDKYISGEETGNVRGRDAKKDRRASTLPEGIDTENSESKKEQLDAKANDSSDIRNDNHNKFRDRDRGEGFSGSKSSSKDKDAKKKRREIDERSSNSNSEKDNSSRTVKL